ncbi:alpha-2-macroglobulin family protein [Lacibacter sp.]|uniref:alpha-2-macroglobulin family protein n=1 Tax=Lacibacter sp. TaxID=1915409 RepID=UPI002B4AC9A7|nr:alpha-2-macroglobulin family protein [Lacibacter sp.]HLP36468.1 alpha-2-macroglobulin family protein [Lacibacter sp.]
MFLKRISLVNLFIFLFSMSLFAQNKFNYTTAWKKVEDLIEKKGLTESALKEVKLIYAAAKKEKNNGQLLKAVLFRLSLQQQKEEDADEKAIKEVEKEISTSAEPLKSVLTNYAAEAYWQYFQNNRWKFYQRTNTTGFSKDDISTWTIDDFHKKISTLYLASLQNKKLIQQTKLDAFDPVINKGNVRHLRPTLYDLLTHRAIEYFQNDERSITKPADAFEINFASAYDPAADFITRKFKTNDSLSLTHKALLLFQELIAFHLADKKADALIDVDLLRLQFVHRYASLENKTELYRMSLNHLLSQYNHQPIVSQAAYLLARDYADYAATYDFKKHKVNDELNPRYYYQKAVELCKKVITQTQLTEGKANCSNLLQEIESKQLSITSEKVNVPNKPFRSLLNYRNTSKAWFRIVKIDQKKFAEMGQNRWEDSYWKDLTALKPTVSFSYNLPATEDHQEHSTEIKVNALPVGTYLLLASADEKFSLAKNVLAVQFFHVSNIAWMHYGNDFFVVNRESGQPLQKANIILWEQSYNYDQRKNVSVKAGNYTSDTNGYFLVNKPAGNNAYNRTLEVSYQNDHLYLDDRAYSYVYNEQKESVDETKSRRTFFFTDRSIYRPGQIMYFKGIVTTKDATTGKPKVVAGLKTKIYLYDANYQKVDSVEVTSNEYGSYSGKFTLPLGRISGQYQLQESVTNGIVSFSVEEYKRPKFFVEYQPINESFKVNDKITVTGNAKAYAGNNVDGAKVKYRVVRQPRLLYPWLSWKWGWPLMQEQEIAHGEVTTKADGSFDISFTAIPDKQVRKELEPVFDYNVIADVTDLNGETRTGETTISVGYSSLQLQLSLLKGELQSTAQFNSINISTKNMMGEFVKSTVTVRMYKLKSPDRLIRERYWELPDQFIMNEKDYRADFPNDEYNNETEKANWERGEKVYEKKDSANVSGEWPMVSGQWSPGWYLIEAVTTDKDGKEVKNQTFVQLTDAAGKLSSPEYVWQLPTTVTVEPGNVANISFGSSGDSVHLIQMNGTNEKEKQSYYQLNNEKKQLDIPVTEEQRGGIGYAYTFVKHNRFYSFTRFVNVPWTNKEIKITYETFRDKTLPGSEEQWKIKISGYKGDKIAAEMLASMYDASLDQFKPHQWNKPDLFPTNFLRNNWSGGGFAQVDSDEKEWEPETSDSFLKEYDYLILFGYQMDHIFNFSPKVLQGRIPGIQTESFIQNAPAPMQDSQALNEVVVGATRSNNKQLSQPFTITPKPEQPKDQEVNTKIRTNFSETAFFFPDLKTDAEGNITFSFTIPEALTKWKAQLLAHTKDLSLGLSEQSIITQKDLMVQPFAPRFLREGDRFEFTAKISNMTDKEMTGISSLELLNTSTMQPVDGWFQNTFPVQHFTVGAKQSTVVKFRTEVPYNFNEALTYRISAKADNKSDGEEATLPVLTNRMLVTESLPLNMRGDGTKTFNFTKLLNADESESLTHHRFTIEFTSNPVWYAVQALPYLMEYPYECAEQTWNRFYANALASHITQKLPRIQQVMQQWKIKDTAALMSNLQKNEELKSALLQETPWVLQAKSEEQQKKNIALLFDMIRMNSELSKNLSQLQQMQSSNGGFVWFKGGPDDRYITQYIITGIGHLQKLNAVPKEQQAALNVIVAKAISYLDKKLKEDYDQLLKYKTPLKNQNISNIQIQFLYMRSFFPETVQTKGTEAAYKYYYGQSQQFWIKQSRYMQGMIALALHRTKDVKTPTAIVKSLKENALFSEEMGMYWKEFNAGYYWYQAPVAAQALMIEVFSDVTKDTKAVNDLKTWLLKQKQTQNWRTTIATAEACYALLLQGGSWIAAEPVVEIKAGNQLFSTSTEKTEAGTGYFKRSIDGNFVQPSFGNINVSVSKSNGQPSWGAAYWQYFENLDKITSAETPLKLQKKYFVERNTANGPVLTPVNEGDELKVGDKIKVRIELRVDRSMEYVHMKDMRPSCMEPVNVISQYKWQGGLGYYETTKDASTNFFFSWLNKGTYVFEYPLFITHAGNYSSGITSIQCMYAPEFTSHSEGVRVKVSE